MKLNDLCKISSYHDNMGMIFNDDNRNILKDFPNNSIDLIFTDPPYLFNKGHGNKIGKEGTSKIANSELYNVNGFTMKEMGQFGKNEIYKLLDESKRICKKMKGYYFCNETALQYYLTWATENNCNFNIIVLNKSPYIMNRNKYATNCEYMVRIIAKSGCGIKVLDYNSPENKIEWIYSVQNFGNILKKDKKHPAQKPEGVIEGVIKLNTEENDIVLDPFAGSGSILKMAKLTKRKYIGIEILEKYYEICKEEIKKIN